MFSNSWNSYDAHVSKFSAINIGIAECGNAEFWFWKYVNVCFGA